MFGNKLPPKLRAKLDAKAMRKFEAAQAGERPKGLSGIFSRGSMPAAGRNFSNPNMMAGLATQAQANMRGRPMVEDIMMVEEAPAGAPMMRKGGKVSAAEAVHKHERAKHKGQPLTKMAKGGSTASKRADGCAVKGKTKGRFV
jgi:hypothetical protein